MHTQKPGNLGRLLILGDELARVRDLLGRKGRGATEPTPLRLHGRPAGVVSAHGSAKDRKPGSRPALPSAPRKCVFRVIAGRLVDSFMGSGLRAEVKGFRSSSPHAFTCELQPVGIMDETV